MLSPKIDAVWEVVDHKEVAQVPIYFDDSDIEITSISSNNISQTYTFDRPLSSAPTVPPSPSSKHSKLRSITKLPTLRRRSTTLSTSSSGSDSSSRRHFPFTLTRTPSNTSSEGDSSSDVDALTTINFGGEGPWAEDFTPAQMQDALKFARSQLINSTEFKRLGGNVLFSEGWSMTKLRKGTQHRLQVRYTGRPAHATASAYDGIPSRSPPFMGMLAGAW